MSEKLTPSTRRRQPYYSFMRPGEFVWLVLLLIFTAWKFWSAYSLADRYFTELISYAAISLLMVIWYAWIRIKRRQCCADAGELLLTILLPQAYQMAFEHYTEGNGLYKWGLFWIYVLLLISMAYQVWRAPKIAKELEELWAAAEEEARKGPADARFIDIDKP